MHRFHTTFLPETIALGCINLSADEVPIWIGAPFYLGYFIKMAASLQGAALAAIPALAVAPQLIAAKAAPTMDWSNL